MGLLEKTRFWRGMGRTLNTGLGAAVAGTAGSMVNKMMAATTAPNLDGEVPWTPLTKPLAESRIALVSTAGVYVDGDTPFDVDADQGDPTFRAVPSDVDRSALRIAHTHYTHRFADQDINVIFPVDRLAELATAGVLRLAPRFFSFGFGGALTSAYIRPPEGTAHQLAEELGRDQVDLALLVPA